MLLIKLHLKLQHVEEVGVCIGSNSLFVATGSRSNCILVNTIGSIFGLLLVSGYFMFTVM